MTISEKADQLAREQAETLQMTKDLHSEVRFLAAQSISEDQKALMFDLISKYRDETHDIEIHRQCVSIVGERT